MPCGSECNALSASQRRSGGVWWSLGGLGDELSGSDSLNHYISSFQQEGDDLNKTSLKPSRSR